MKTLNNITYNDLYSACGATCTYKNFTVLIQNGYYTIKLNKKYVDGGCLYSNTIGKIKNEIKNEIKKHNINDLLKMSIDTLRAFLSFDEIEKLSSYIKVKNSTVYDKATKAYLMNEIREYFIHK